MPKKFQATWPEIFNFFAGIASIIGLIISFIADKTISGYVHYAFLIIVITTLLIHNYLRERKKLHRYSQAVFFYHYANHVVRDHLSQLKMGKTKNNTYIVLQDLTDSIAQCFSVITGKRCRTSIKELNQSLNIETISRDKIGEKSSGKRIASKIHPLTENTDFYNLWHLIEGCSRYYLENNIPNAWKKRKYKNSSFQETGDPEIITIFGFTKIIKWPLPYNSTLVFPIRYTHSFAPPKIGTSDKNPDWQYRGFLCIDCNSRNVFDSRFMPELGTGFADLLYIMLDQSEFIIDSLENSGQRKGE